MSLNAYDSPRTFAAREKVIEASLSVISARLYQNNGHDPASDPTLAVDKACDELDGALSGYMSWLAAEGLRATPSVIDELRALADRIEKR
jgi:hypothetical protein